MQPASRLIFVSVFYEFSSFTIFPRIIGRKEGCILACGFRMDGKDQKGIDKGSVKSLCIRSSGRQPCLKTAPYCPLGAPVSVDHIRAYDVPSCLFSYDKTKMSKTQCHPGGAPPSLHVYTILRLPTHSDTTEGQAGEPTSFKITAHFTGQGTELFKV